ncbi:Ribonuclease R [Symmachiella dynata]|uniref:Ribonuclease R n=1 Tax=Symmachiella dynata TaxID=2527995 RepID=A0A517ZNF7_9PLAN|nr:ribonuclease R [Symmachiella dynata]QDT48414.1 Ribonuclease R [Symmachiella dynata]QDU44007.1 Ribonuclease R [Symmachiella dynata]
MPKIEQQILELLAKPEYKPVKAVPLAKLLKVPKKNLPAFREALDALVESGAVFATRNGLLRATPPHGFVTGVIKKAAGGFGFLIQHAETAQFKEDIYIAPKNLGNALTGDEAIVKLLKGKGRDGDRVRGRVEQILQRATNAFVGTYFESGGRSYVQVDGTNFSDPIFVGDPGAKGAQPDDKIVFEMVRFPSHFRQGEGVITEVLGARGAPGVDTAAVIHEYGLPDAFPEDVLEEARIQAQQFDESELGDRVDLTGETIVTIDPKTARDFDDAISLSRSDDGHWHLGVHIADVSHFVQPGTRLDQEAQQRSTSVYLPDRVLPMIPEVISNSLASLQQGKVRFTKSAMIEFSPEGMPIHVELKNTAIKVVRRFAYEQVLPIIFHPEEHKSRAPARVRDLLARMYELAMLLRARRFARGALELSMPETKIVLGKDGEVIGAKSVEHDASHQIIEEFMLAANIAVADKLAEKGIAFLRRVHDAPDEAKLKSFGEFVTSLGFELKQYQSKSHVQDLLNAVRDQPLMRAVNYALLRSMKQAVYSPDELGHYALSEENYCHFTSPIRRYPDLTIHRIVDRLIKGDKRHEDALELVALGQHCSFNERRAEQAERELIKVKLLTYLSDQIGLEFDAVITGVQKFGFFCQGLELPAEGLVHISTLAEDFYDYEQESHRIVGRRSGQEYRLGGTVRVVVTHVDVDRRELNFRVLATTTNSSATKNSSAKKKQSKKRQPPTQSSKPSAKKAGKQPRKKSNKKKAAASREKAKRKKKAKKQMTAPKKGAHKKRSSAGGKPSKRRRNKRGGA